MGTELLLVPTVSVLVRDGEGRVLLVDNLGAQAWTLPGGIVEPGERPEEAAVREVLEETGVEVRVDGVLDVFGGPQFQWTYPNGDRLAGIVAVYRGLAVGGTARADDDETRAVRWFAADALPEPLSVPTQVMLGRLL